jgi:hypothetical protein
MRERAHATITRWAIKGTLWRRRMIAAVAAAAAFAALGAASTAQAESVQVVHQALPTECYSGIGQEIKPIANNASCPSGSQPRTTESYVWGGTVAEDHTVWFGTLADALCANLLAYTSAFKAVGKEFPVPFETSDVACNFNALSTPFPNGFSDARPAQIYQYVPATNKLTNRTPTAAESPGLAEIAGIRAMGEFNNVVIAGGLTASIGDGQSSGGGVHLFAFEASSGKFLAEETYPTWNNIKNFLNYNGAMYLGVGLSKSLPSNECSCDYPAQGQIIKLQPSVSHPLPAAEEVESVGNVGQTPAYFTVIKNRIAISTYLNAPGESDGLYMSPKIPSEGQLTSADQTNWTEILNAAQFIPDPVTAATALGFGVASYEGDLYWVLGNYPGQSTLAHIATYANSFPFTVAGLARWWLNSEFGAQVMRISNPGTPKQQIQLLYGDKEFPTFAAGKLGGGHWISAPNLLGLTPLYGSAGFNTPNNDYGAWGIAAFNKKLYMGGFDVSKIVREVVLNPESKFVSTLLGHPVLPAELRAAGLLIAPNKEAAGPVWDFPNGESPAEPLTTTGFGNADNWGVRGLFPINNKTLVMSTNNGFNFPAQGAPNPPQRPGWQLLTLTR